MTDSNNNGKVPVSIVNTVINKIADFTKEIEVLRAQLPNKETTNNKVDSLDRKMDKTLAAIKLIFALAMVIVVLSFLGAKLLERSEIHEKESIYEVVDKKLEKLRKEELQLILDKIEGLHRNGEGPEG